VQGRSNIFAINVIAKLHSVARFLDLSLLIPPSLSLSLSLVFFTERETLFL